MALRPLYLICSTYYALAFVWTHLYIVDLYDILLAFLYVECIIYCLVCVILCWHLYIMIVLLFDLYVIVLALFYTECILYILYYIHTILTHVSIFFVYVAQI